MLFEFVKHTHTRAHASVRKMITLSSLDHPVVERLVTVQYLLIQLRLPSYKFGKRKNELFMTLPAF